MTVTGAGRFARAWTPFVLGVGSLAIALKFSTFLDHTVFFPANPDILDILFLVAASSYLIVLGLESIFTLLGRKFPIRFRENEEGISSLTSVILMTATTVLLAVILYLIVLWFP